jgi:KipI family sensor histidine kinase inhibitor
MKIAPPTPHPLGDSAVTLSFGTQRSAELLEQIHATTRFLTAQNIPYVDDVVPAYLAITVFYDATRVAYSTIADQLITACAKSFHAEQANADSREHRIGVRYDGPDLESVASQTGLSIERVIELHTGRVYSVDLLGFVPGYAYLSELDPALHLPRREQPRPRVPAGSVAIAGAQTGVYPLETPGGWHLIGRTEQVMFDPARNPPALLRAGDTVRFERIV